MIKTHIKWCIENKTLTIIAITSGIINTVIFQSIMQGIIVIIATSVIARIIEPKTKT